MAQVITFENVTPIARGDSVAWEEARVEESATTLIDSAYTAIDTIDLSALPGGLDDDPANPAARLLTTELASDTLELWYRIVFLDGTGDESAPTDPIQNTSTGSAYASTDELNRILKLRTPSPEQTAAMARVLSVAAGEINAEIDRADTDDPLTGWQLALCAEVNLERAVEHWRQQESPFGIIGLGADLIPTRTSRDSWERHAHKLSPLKTRWGLA